MDWQDVIGLGVAGNFAGHLEQAGEAGDFANLETADAGAPKGVFPFYVPGDGDHFLHIYPVSDSELRLGSSEENHQIEPEVALLCDLTYEAGRVTAVLPRTAFAHNDCSIRREGAKKISQKKNWGPATKGTAAQGIEIDRFEPGGVLDGYRIASFLRREGTLHPYGVDSPVASYSYLYGQLLDWLVEKLNDQRDEGPLEDIAGWIRGAGHPSRALISIGATRYTEFGESNFLAAGDEAIVAVYDGGRYAASEIETIAAAGGAAPAEGLSLLRQVVR